MLALHRHLWLVILVFLAVRISVIERIQGHPVIEVRIGKETHSSPVTRTTRDQSARLVTLALCQERHWIVGFRCVISVGSIVLRLVGSIITLVNLISDFLRTSNNRLLDDHSHHLAILLAFVETINKSRSSRSSGKYLKNLPVLLDCKDVIDPSHECVPSSG